MSGKSKSFDRTVPIRLQFCARLFRPGPVTLIKERLMSAREDLSNIIAALEGEGVRVSFADGEIYDLEIKSTSRLRERGTFDTTVIWAINCLRAADVETGVEMKFRLDDVEKVQILKDARCVFDRSTGQK